MTKEEAIKLLSQIMDALLVSNSWLPSTDNPIKEAFGMAIEALQAQESCNNLATDTISRDKVLNLVLDVCYDVMDECETVAGIYGEEVYTDVKEVDAILKCNKRIRNSIRQLPSEQLRPKGEWNYSDDMYETRVCSVCGFDTEDYKEYNYCPNCGAEMEGSDD